MSYKQSTQPPTYLNFGTIGLLVNASAAHPPIKHSPPNGVTGPSTFHRCGSNTKRYRLPLNIVIPVVKRPMASVFCGAIADAKVSATECINWIWSVNGTSGYVRGSMLAFMGENQGISESYLVLSRSAPVCELRGVRDAFLEAMSTECAKHDRGGAIDAAYCPEGRRHVGRG